MAAPFWEWLISPNHNEIVVDQDRPAPPTDVADQLVDRGLSPDHNEIVVRDGA